MTKRQLEIREEMASERADERESYYHKSENAKRDKLAEEQALELEDDIEKENENQSNFYEELGPPKILYKCKNSDFEKALGATYGTYNSLLEKVSGICGAVGYEVIDNEK